MENSRSQTPPGPESPYRPTEDLLLWVNENHARYGDLYKASVFGGDVYVVSKPEYCEHILRWNWRNYPRQGQVVKRISLLLGNGLISSNGEFWANQRRMIQPAFTKNAVGDLIGMIARINGELLVHWTAAAARRESVNVTEDLSRMVLQITLTAIFGEDYAAVAPSFAIVAADATRNLEFAQTLRVSSQVIREIVARRRRDEVTADDILGRMLQARDRDQGRPMPDAQLVKEVMTLIVAGHETTAGLLNWLWRLLAKHPSSQQRLSEEFARSPWNGAPTMEALGRYGYTRRVIEEALRLYPPLWLMTRKALEEDRLGDFLIPAGAEIYISPYLIQRSPALWTAPDQFDPDRTLADNVQERHPLAACPFGAGPRNCIGELFARVEIQVHLMMFARVLSMRCAEDRPAEMSAGMNLLSKDDFIMWPEIKAGALP